MKKHYPLILLFSIVMTALIYYACIQDNIFERRKVLLVVALSEEAAPIISRFNLVEIKRLFKNLPMKGYAGRYHQLDILLVMNGQDPVFNSKSARGKDGEFISQLLIFLMP
jgi:hypothetical protein